MSTWVLFHRIADSQSGAARRRLSECQLTDEIHFRNVDVSEDAHKELLSILGRDEVPCLVAEGQTYVGIVEIEKFILDFIKGRT